MTKKESLSFNVPKPLRRGFERIAARYGAKEKWAVCAAAILMLIEAGEAEQDRVFREVKAHDHQEADMEKIVAEFERRSPQAVTGGPRLRIAAKPHPDR